MNYQVYDTAMLVVLTVSGLVEVVFTVYDHRRQIKKTVKRFFKKDRKNRLAKAVKQDRLKLIHASQSVDLKGRA